MGVCASLFVLGWSWNRCERQHEEGRFTREHVSAAAVVRNESCDDAQGSASFCDVDVVDELADHQQHEGHRQEEE